MLGLTRRALIGAITALALAVPALADDGHPYFGPEAVDLTVLLVPPPAGDSSVTAAELAEIKALQASVSEDRKKQAIADDDEGLAPFIATTSLASLDPAKAPLTAALIQRVLDTEDAVTKPAKKFFARPRPPKVDDKITPFIELSKSNAYPSGHTTNGTAIAIVLSDMAPEKRAELMARAEDYATSRLIVGVHYRSDLGAGFASGALIAQALKQNAEFQKEFAPAKAELRAALGLQ
ncbi:phosphatase PAP2 family protein [Aestuariivirga sp.]|uniref:acid phosphatase n=1 Tax=Aestuariivirga sp. TaxID=2650926 RepID=UPI0025B7ECE3|nr:phosphatase PAP2 family protein [Aestuariivirga sp.]MCA3555356.1 phosphatase PAP2 family protein [Aestuariivirga sp.]